MLCSSLWFRTGPFLLPAHTAIFLAPKYQPAHRTGSPRLFQEVHNRQFHRRFVSCCITEHLLGGCVGRPPKIAHFEDSVIEHDVLGFNVPVDDVLVVHVLEGRGDLFAVVGRLLFG